MNTCDQAAVLVPVYRQQDAGICVVLIRRREGGLHGGELGFPGGRHSPADRTLLDTVLRETHEEIGLSPAGVHVIEQLPTVDTVTTGISITPFLARIDRPQAWILCEREVAEVLEIPVSALAAPAQRGEFLHKLPDWDAPRPFAFIRIGDHRLWGATYRILEPLLDRLLRGAWPI